MVNLGNYFNMLYINILSSWTFEQGKVVDISGKFYPAEATPLGSKGSSSLQMMSMVLGMASFGMMALPAGVIAVIAIPCRW